MPKKKSKLKKVIKKSALIKPALKKAASKSQAKPPAKVAIKAAPAKPAMKPSVKKLEKSDKKSDRKAAPPKRALKVATPAKKHIIKKPEIKTLAKPMAAKMALKAAPVPVDKAAKKDKSKPKSTVIPDSSSETHEIRARESQQSTDAPESVDGAAGSDEEQEASDEVVLTDAEGRRYCRVKDCDQLASVDGYCRYHYLLYWKRIQIRKKILTEGKLERYVEELTARYPDKFLDMLRKDLRSEKEFLAAIQELEIDESATENELEDETQTYIDEVRGMGEPAAREEEDF